MFFEFWFGLVFQAQGGFFGEILLAGWNILVRSSSKGVLKSCWGKHLGRFLEVLKGFWRDYRDDSLGH